MDEKSIHHFEVIDIQEIGEGSRVCIDLVDVVEPDEGVFVGNTSSGYIFVLSENREAKNYKPRPFRINVGAIHQYILLDGKKTVYLSDITSRDKIEVYNETSKKEIAIGRVKIEKRKFVRIIAKIDTIEISATFQEAESVYLMEESKGIISILELKIGDKIKCMIDKPGRHLGERIEEYIVEV